MVAAGQRDTLRMERFSCQSYLAFRPSLENRTLAIILRHTYHTPYVDHQLSPAVLEFIQARNALSTPAEIYRELQTARPLGWEQLLSKSIINGNSQTRIYGGVMQILSSRLKISSPNVQNAHLLLILPLICALLYFISLVLLMCLRLERRNWSWMLPLGQIVRG